VQGDVGLDGPDAVGRSPVDLVSAQPGQRPHVLAGGRLLDLFVLAGLERRGRLVGVEHDGAAVGPQAQAEHAGVTVEGGGGGDQPGPLVLGDAPRQVVAVEGGLDAAVGDGSGPGHGLRHGPIVDLAVDDAVDEEPEHDDGHQARHHVDGEQAGSARASHPDLSAGACDC
jgi:hypothetical protein